MAIHFKHKPLDLKPGKQLDEVKMFELLYSVDKQ